MKKLIIILALIFAIPVYGGNTITLFDGNLSLTLPDGFAEMPADIVEVKYPNANRPKYIYSNGKSTTSIAIDIMQAELKDSQLSEFCDFIEKTMKRMIPGCEILKKEITEINETRWARLELKSNALDTDIHNIIIMAALNGKPLMINYNSTKEEYELVKDELSKSINSIKIQ